MNQFLPHSILLAALLWMAPSLDAATGSAETGDVTIDTRSAAPPDVAVGAKLNQLVGRNVYLPTRQQANLVSKKLRPVTGHAVAANRGSLPDALRLRASSRGNAFFKVTYLAPANATAKLTAGTHLTSELAPGAEARIRIEVKPNKKKLTKKKGKRTRILKKTLALPIQATSTVDPALQDAATLRVQTK